jgi:hypothetical protein
MNQKASQGLCLSSVDCAGLRFSTRRHCVTTLRFGVRHLPGMLPVKAELYSCAKFNAIDPKLQRYFQTVLATSENGLHRLSVCETKFG